MRPLASAADIHALRMQLNAQQAPPVPAPGPPAPPTAPGPGPAPTTDIGDPAQATQPPGPGVPGAQEMLFHLQAISNHEKTPALVQATHAVAKAIAELQSALHAGQAQAKGQTPGQGPGQGRLPGQGQMNFSAADSASPSQLEVRTQADPAKGRGW